MTFRLADSLPAQLARQLASDRERLLKEAGLNPKTSDLNAEINGKQLSPREESILRWKLSRAWDRCLDQLRGECHLRRRDAAKIVADGLLKFDGDRYVMAAFVVMPNHVHLLAASAKPGGMKAQGTAWRKFFAREINPLVGRSGHLWQEDQFDHLVRSETSFDRIRRYIGDNPVRAGLRPGEYRLYVCPDW